MANRFRERQAELEPSRVQYAIEQLAGLGYEVGRWACVNWLGCASVGRCERYPARAQRVKELHRI